METKHLRHTVRHAFCGRLAVVAIAWAVASVTDAEAQTTSKQESKWDVAFVAGYLGVRPEIELQDRYADRWYHAGQAGVTFGRYFMPHLKAEVELSTSAEGRAVEHWSAARFWRSYPVPLRHRTVCHAARDLGFARLSVLRQRMGAPVRVPAASRATSSEFGRTPADEPSMSAIRGSRIRRCS